MNIKNGNSRKEQGKAKNMSPRAVGVNAVRKGEHGGTKIFNKNNGKAIAHGLVDSSSLLVAR
jgi:hypothetical protein